jgi:hypothetical protein
MPFDYFCADSKATFTKTKHAHTPTGGTAYKKYLVCSISNLQTRMSNIYERYDYHVSSTTDSCKRTSLKPALTNYGMHYVNVHPIREFVVL